MADPVILVHEPSGVTRISRWVFNCYVIHDAGAGKPIVVDAGLPSNGRDAVERIRRVHGPSVAPACVISTHGHSDHVAGIAEVVGAAPGPVLLPERCRDYLSGDEAPTPGPRQVVKILPVFRDQPVDFGALRELGSVASSAGYGRQPMVMPVPADGFLADGDPLPDAEGWTVLHGPGHTEDSTCLYHEATATLLSGDTVLTQGGIAWFNPEVTDPIASAATEDRFRSLEVEHLFPGHGLPLHGTDLLRHARSFRDTPHRRGWAGRLSIALGDWR